MINLENSKYLLFNGNCLDILKEVDTASIDLVMTSPPYADARKDTYGGPKPDEYVNWFLPISEQIFRILKPSGTFILNIKEKIVNKERHTYVLELILALKKQGWLWTEEWIWHKRNSFPGKWPNRFRDAWERCLQFNVNSSFKMNQDSVMIPIGDWADTRLKKLCENDNDRSDSITGSSFGRKMSNWVGKEMVYPTNVLYFPTECSNKNHPAAYPKSIPEFFIKLFTDINDIVLDPFQGSGTTGVSGLEQDRRYVGIDLNKEYIDMTDMELRRFNMDLFQ